MVLAHRDGVASGQAETLEEEVSFPDGRRATWLSTKAPLRDSWEPLVDCLNGLLDGAPLADLQVVGRHELIIRNSTGPAPKE